MQLKKMCREGVLFEKYNHLDCLLVIDQCRASKLQGKSYTIDPYLQTYQLFMPVKTNHQEFDSSLLIQICHSSIAQKSSIGVTENISMCWHSFPRFPEQNLCPCFFQYPLEECPLPPDPFFIFKGNNSASTSPNPTLFFYLPLFPPSRILFISVGPLK